MKDHFEIDLTIGSPHKLLSEQTIDELVSNFNPDEYDPSVCLNHDEKGTRKTFPFNLGKIKKLWKDGKNLIGKFLLHPSIKEMIDENLIKERSLSYWDNYKSTGKKVLRHLALLGPYPPVIKGMPKLKFDAPELGEIELGEVSFRETDGPHTTIEFSEDEIVHNMNYRFEFIADLFRKIREWIIEKESRESADKIFDRFTLSDIERAFVIKDEDQSGLSFSEIIDNLQESNNMDEKNTVVKFDEKQNERLVAAAVKEKEEELIHNFSEKEQEFNGKIVELGETIKEKDAKIKELEGKIIELSEKNTKIEVTAFVEKHVAEGRIKPARKESKIIDLMEAFKSSERLFKSMCAEIEELEPIIEFGEVDAAKGKGKTSTELSEEHKAITGITDEHIKQHMSTVLEMEKEELKRKEAVI